MVKKDVNHVSDTVADALRSRSESAFETMPMYCCERDSPRKSRRFMTEP